MGKGFGCGNVSKNQPKFSISAGKGLVKGEKFGTAYKSISAGKFSPTKNGGKRSSKVKV